LAIIFNPRILHNHTGVKRRAAPRARKRRIKKADQGKCLTSQVAVHIIGLVSKARERDRSDPKQLINLTERS
jgi:hypothetical protein